MGQDIVGHLSSALPAECSLICRLTTPGQAAIPEWCLTLIPLTGTDSDLQIDVPV